jgi:hypothetical protein
LQTELALPSPFAEQRTVLALRPGSALIRRNLPYVVSYLRSLCLQRAELHRKLIAAGVQLVKSQGRHVRVFSKSGTSRQRGGAYFLST